MKSALTAAGLPIMLSETHIVPVMVGDPEKCKRASDLLLYEHGIYLQPINYPTVPRGTERLRITARPYHDDVLIDQLAEVLTDVWRRVALTTWFPGNFRTVEGVLKDVQENRKVGSVLLGPKRAGHPSLVHVVLRRCGEKGLLEGQVPLLVPRFPSASLVRSAARTPLETASRR
jgi:Aminotransferase class I and II